MRKSIVKMVSVVLSIVVLVTAFATSAMATVDSCVHANRKVGDVVATIYDEATPEQHHLIRTYSAHCNDCGIDFNPTEAYYEPHSFTTIISLLSDSHSGAKHTYVYSARCVCGYVGTVSYTYTCPGPPCPAG